MSNLRSGKYGKYYGSYIDESAPLTAEQMQTNAQYIYSFLSAEGWSLEAISGVLGNMEYESHINPGRWQSDSVNWTSGGYGLVQWTPTTRHISWCEERGLDPSAMDSNLTHLNWEINDGDDYYSTSTYPESFSEFSKSTKAPYYLACAFAWNYERSATVLWGTEAEQETLRQNRGGAAEKWYLYLSGQTPTPPTPTPGRKTKRRKFNFLLYGNYNRRITKWQH